MAPNPPVDNAAAPGNGKDPANGASATGPAKGSGTGTNTTDTPADTTKRVRTSKPKVKTGCSNCKQRRIKCDEKRPSCTQCVRSKKVCTGYPPPPRGSRPFEEIAIAPKPILMAAAPALAPGPTLAARPTTGAASLAAAPRPLAAVTTAGPQPFPLSQSLLPTESAYAQAYRQPLQPQAISNAQSQSQSYPVVRAKEFQAQTLEQGQGQAPSTSRQVAHIPPRRAQKLQQRRNLPPNIPIAAIAAASGATFLYLPSTNLPFTEQEGNYFQLFRSQTANELSGFFDDVFWSRLVLAECHSEAAIRHAVVALGALYKTLETSTESPPTSPADPNYNSHDNARGHWQVALKQYAEACHDLRITDRDDERTQRTRLMASVLLACFDSFIGHHKHAIVQIQTGLGLLHQLRVQRRAVLADPSTASEPVESELTQMFTRLAIQAKSYDMAFHFPQPYVIQLLSAGPAGGSKSTPPSNTTSSPSDPMAAATASSSTSPPPAAAPVTPLPTSTHQRPIPDQFTTLREARLSWDSLLERIFRFMEYMLQHANGPPHLLPQSMKSYGYEFKMHMDAWSNAFDPLLANRSSPGVTSQEKAGIAVLKMFQVMGLILYAMTFSDSEMMFDAYQQQFKTIVDLANEVVGDEERRAAAARCRDPTQCAHLSHHVDHGPATDGNPAQGGQDDSRHFFEYRTSHIKASFSADLGIVPPLYVVATKSRDRVLRRQAIQLLRSSARREGMWDSELAARIAMWVVAIEEEGEEAEFYEALQRYGHVDMNMTGGGGGGGGSGSVRSGSSSLGSPMSPPAFMQQQVQQQQPPPSVSRGSSVDFGAIPLGPGGNARWDTRRASQASVLHTTNSAHGASSASTSPRDLASLPSVPLASPPIVPPPASAFSHITAPLDPSIPYFLQTQFPIPAEKRILVKTCEFDLREHTATLKCGTRGLAAGVLDAKTRETEIRW